MDKRQMTFFFFTPSAQITEYFFLLHFPILSLMKEDDRGSATGVLLESVLVKKKCRSNTMQPPPLPPFSCLASQGSEPSKKKCMAQDKIIAVLTSNFQSSTTMALQ
jgi:hypothetical protein